MPARNWLGWYCRQWQWLILSSALKRHWKFALASTLKPFFFVGKQVAKQILWKTVIWWYDTTARSRTKREWWYANHSKKIQVDGKNRRKPVLEQNKQFSRYATVFFSFSFFFARLICLFSLETLCLFSDSVNCSYRVWAWVTFYRLHSEKVDHF